jgi:hypothetical protein
MAADHPLLDPFQAEATKLGISQDAAQQLVAAMAPKITEMQQAEWARLNEKWQAEVKNDPEFAGAKLNEMTAKFGRMFDELVGPTIPRQGRNSMSLSSCSAPGITR